MRKIKLRVITGTRADYGLLFWPTKLLVQNPKFDVGLVVTGGHLENSQANTISNIEQDGLPIVHRMALYVKGDQPEHLAEAMGKATDKFAKFLTKDKPDVVMFLGDRWEILACATASMLHNIPMVHIHGGEATWGLIDDPIRHSLTKMSHIHFVSTEAYRKRVIQMGEHPSRVFTVGAPGLDFARRVTFLKQTELESLLGNSLGEKNVVVTYHPVTLSEEKTTQEVTSLFKALGSLPTSTKIWIGLPNMDTFSQSIRTVIGDFIEKTANAHSFTSLGSAGYLSLIKASDLVVGNSSSGIIEAPYLGKRVLNIGDRQKGRMTDQHVTHVSGNEVEITRALQQLVRGIDRPREASVLYGTGYASEKIVEILAQQDWDSLLEKGFYDLP